MKRAKSNELNNFILRIENPEIKDLKFVDSVSRFNIIGK